MQTKRLYYCIVAYYAFDVTGEYYSVTRYRADVTCVEESDLFINDRANDLR
ncbi:hypothetical protein [Bacteroides reticulotermitis]|uniref:Uncharacterized protein n=2 Tax=Bacteroides reticulotermitis TaxID=1133319 RepID=W4UQ97_9BACE|nr:hypothetical protein [Bacteroides reticulotermitis]MBB4043011.1 hypothetical protein [Bacteroides reticulotermitis]GAE82957.1 hypothetical protein JCM10512_1200 [Bacteroides reticulotermitis JCM 10512]HJD74611.1 hypothetical protein [Bacteroides reticulotermitis]